jgi:hypothetical protein
MREMMTRMNALAGGFLATWLIGALIIADFPPPPGFIVLVVLLIACALLIRFRVPVYLKQRASGKRGVARRAALEGVLGGIAVTAVLSSFAGDPSIETPLSARLIGLSGMALLGAGNAVAAYAIAVLVLRR